MKFKLILLIVLSVAVHTVLPSEISCQIIQSAEYGVIDSHFPGESRARSCSWIIRLPPRERINLYFSHFHMANSTSKDYLVITRKIFGREETFTFTTVKIPFVFVSHSAVVNITLCVNNISSTSHFRLFYRTSDHFLERTEEFRKSRGVIVSPYYPNEIPTAGVATYNIVAPMGYVINLKFTHLDIQVNSSVCVNNVSVRDGISEDGRIIDSFCDKNTSKIHAYQSSKNHMSVQFTTLHPLRQLQGFRAVYFWKVENLNFHNVI